MNRRQARWSNRTRSHWWSAMLSVLVALSLVARPSDICALVESLPGHSHAGAPHSDGHAHEDGHSHGTPESHAHGGQADHHGDHHGDHHAGHPHPGEPSKPEHPDASASFSPVEAPHPCCSDSAVPRPVAAPASRSAEPDERATIALFAPAVLPPSAGISTLTACHGRDGPPDKPPRPQFLASSRLGRAPPTFA